MIIFLYGPDNFRSKQKLNEIIEGYIKTNKTGLNLRFFEEEKDFGEIKKEIFSPSIFKEKKLFIFKKIFNNQKIKNELLDIFKKTKEIKNIIFVIWHDGEVPKTDPLFVFLKERAKKQEFKLLNGTPLRLWIKKEVSKKNSLISEEAVDKLIELVGNDSWKLFNEIQKLVTFKNQNTIRKKDVELLIQPEIKLNIFKTVDAIAFGNKKAALFLMHKHLEKGDNPSYLMFMISRHFRYLLIVREMMERNVPFQLIAKKTKIGPRVFGKIWHQAKKFNLAELKKIYFKIFELDLAIKTGKIDPVLALDLFLIGI
mgnify:CR=1 FL=1